MGGTIGTQQAAGAKPQLPSKSRLLSVTRKHEGGIASNRGSACRGEFVLGLCTHRPSRSGNGLAERMSYCRMHAGVQTPSEIVPCIENLPKVGSGLE